MASTSTCEMKALGAFFTPPHVARALVRWAVRHATDRLLDPACGDGRFLAEHDHSIGVEYDADTLTAAAARAPSATIYAGNFFTWAQGTSTRFDCAVGNPPFIRYQRFSGALREQALRFCRQLGAGFSGLTSSWAPFLVAAASLLKDGGRMAFVVPAEIGHAPYAVPLIRYLTAKFTKVQIVAVRRKIFPELSEDVWFLFAEGFGGATDHVVMSSREAFTSTDVPPARGRKVSLVEWTRWNHRLRPFLMSEKSCDTYDGLRNSGATIRLVDVARIGIGYVTGANDFFHLRPSQARLRQIPEEFLLPTVRSARKLPPNSVTKATIQSWVRQDEPILLLRIDKGAVLPKSVQDYLDSPAGRRARSTYKCRNRRPWFAVPDVRIPAAFLSYMSGKRPSLVANSAGCSCSNSVLAIDLVNGWRSSAIRTMWNSDVVQLSCEVEGHPLGGGMLKLEPGEAGQVLLPQATFRLSKAESLVINEGISTLRKWRHYA